MKFHRVPIDKLDEMPRDVVQVFENCYWALDKDENILFARLSTRQFKYGSPQCNRDRRAVQLLVKSTRHPCVSVRQIPLVLVPWNTAVYS